MKFITIVTARRTASVSVLSLGVCSLCALSLCAAPGRAQYYVATNGNDAWSGRLPAPNAKKTDGPFATLLRARDAARAATMKKQKTVFVRAGTYYLREPVVLTPADSGLSLLAYRGERPLLSGGVPVTGWKRGAGNLWTAPIPKVAPRGASGASLVRNIRLLRAGGEWQTLARHPNFDAKNPYQGGWSFVVYDGPRGGFGAGVARIHTPGDWLQWQIEVPSAGDYKAWLLYAAENKPYGHDDMAGRVTLRVDNGEPVALQNLRDTGSFGAFRWSHAATLHLSKGRHTLRWTNVMGGGFNFDALALCDAADWTPREVEPGAELTPPPADKHLVVVQAENFSAAQGRELEKSEAPSPAYTDRFQFRAGDIGRYPLSPQPEIHIFPAWGWVSSILHVARIDHDARTVYVEKNSNASEELRVGNRYYISNVREALDQPGEWFADEAAGAILFRPKTADFQRRPVVVPVLDRLFDLRGEPNEGRWVERITIKGFELRDTTYSREIGVYSPEDAAIWLSGARGCVIEGNRWLTVGGYAARLENYSERNEFVGNEVAFNGQGGVILSGAVATQPRHNLIAGNWMHHLGQVYKHVAGVYCITASDTRIAHNRFEHLPRYAISFKGFDATHYSHRNVAEYNDILQTNLETNDTGAIETLGREKQPTGNVVQYNRILDVVGLKTTPEGEFLSPHFTWGIYLDDYSSGTTVRGNLVARHDWGGGCIHGGQNNLFENNIFIEGLSHQMRYQVRDEFCKGNRFVRNIIWYRAPSADLFKHTGQWREDVLSQSDNNLFWHPGGAQFFNSRSLTPLGTLAQWRAAGYDRHSRVADPLFENAARDDYRLRPDSPAFKLGFRPLPWEKIGLRGYARSWRRNGK